MSKGKKELNTTLSAQPGLFDTDIVEGALDIALGFRQSLSRAFSDCKAKSRYQIAAEISELTRSSVSKDMLDKYTSSNLDYGLRAEILPAVCMVTRTLEPYRYLLDPLGSDVLNPEDRDLIRLARLQEKAREIDAEIMQIRSKRGIK